MADSNRLLYNTGTHQQFNQSNKQMQGFVRNPKVSIAQNHADGHMVEEYVNHEKIYKPGSQPPPQTFTTVTAATGNLIVANSLNNRGEAVINKQQGVPSNHSKTPVQSKYASQNHHTLQCLSDINEFKQKVNMVLQSQAFPGNQTNQQKNSMVQEYSGNQVQQQYNPAQRMPKLVQNHDNNQIGYLGGQHAYTQQVNKKLNITEEMTNDQNSENLTSAFLSFKNSLKDQSQIPQTHHFLRSSKESNRNLYQHLKNATTQQAEKVIQDDPRYQQSVKDLPTEAVSQPTSALNNQKKQYSNGNQMYSNSYVQNNQKQQQRRKLLFEYGLEKKLQSQSINANNSNANTNRLRKSQGFKNGTDIEPSGEDGEQHNQDQASKEERDKQSFDLLENLKHLNIEALDEKEREQLRFLSLQYQFHLQQYEESQKAELLKKEKLQSEMKALSPKGSIGGQPSFNKEPNSAVPIISDDKIIVDSDYNVNAYSTGKNTVHTKNNKSVTKRSDLYQSQEKFIENEKNLSEDRLRKKDNGRDSSIVNISGIEPKPQLNKLQQENQKADNAETNRNELRQNPADSRNEKQEKNDHQNSQNLKRIASQNNIERKKEPGWLMKMNQQYESKSFFQSENLNQQNGMNSQAINNLQHFIENLGANSNKTSVHQIQQQQIKIQQQDQSTSGSSHQNQQQRMMAQRSNEVTQLYNKYNKVYRQVESKQQYQTTKKELIHCPKPTPTQITQMSSPAQRLNLFKILQAREHIKFQNIQNEKMQQLQSLQEDQEFRQNMGQEEPKRFLDFVQRKGATNKKSVFSVNQFQSKQLQNLQNIQQLKAMQKQQLNDQKAFGIFQMNELAQFRSMGESNQKQILLNNLQQGKFEEVEPFQPQQPEHPKTPATNKLQALQNNQHLNYGRSHKVEALQQKDMKLHQNDQYNLDKTIDININQLGNRMKKTASDGQSSQNQINNEVNSPKDQYGQSIFDQQKQQEFDSRQQNFSQVKNYSEMGISIFQSSRGNPPQGSGPKSVQQLHALGQSNNQSSMSNNNPNQQQLHVIRNPIINPVQMRYEESKMQFEACLRENIMKQQAQRMKEISHLPQQLGAKTRFSSQTKNMNLDNILPGFPQRIVNGDENPKYEDKYRTRVKARTGASLSNTNKDNSKKLRLNGNKDEDGSTTVPESTKSAAKKIGDKDDKDKKDDDDKDKDKDKDKEKDGELAPIEEVKKVPRYFPPRKMPNPFTEAANEQERFIQARKDALAKYSNISKNRFKQDESAPLKFVIKPGNNSKMINRVIEKSGRMEPKANGHPGWEAADDHMDSLYNFKWKPTSGGLKYDLIGKHGLKQVINHVKGHGNLTTKDNLFINMKSYYESQKQNIYETVPLTIVLDYLKEDVGDKVEMFLALHKIIAKHKDSDVEIINQKMQEVQISKEKSVKTPYKISDCCHKGQNLWLLKPTMLNRGIGIHIFQTFDELREIMCTSYGIGRGKRDKASIFNTHNHNHLPRGQPDENGEKKEMIKSFTFVIQKLIEKPMLYHNRKFDLRVWAILNSADGKIYVWKECYVRTSSSQYQDYDPDTPNEEQIFMQLTNNAVQNTGAEYGKYEEGNIISTDTLFAYISKQPQGKGKGKRELEAKFKADQDAIIINTIKSVKGKLLHQKNTFELLGYDFILDEDLNTILIEVNTNPCLEESNTLLRHLLPRMIDDCLNITMDPVFANGVQAGENYNNKSNTEKYKSVFKLPGDVFVIDQKDKPTGDDMHPGYKDDENLFRHIYTMEIVQ